MAYDKPYTPQAGSLASNMCGFFTNNPDETLGLDDITDKFDTVRGNVHTLLSRCLESGLLSRVQSEGEYIYCRGPNLPTLNAIGADPERTSGIDIGRVNTLRPRKTAPTPPQAILTQAGATLPPLPSVDEVVIEDNIPLPERGTGRTDWTPLLAKLKPGQSAQLPIRAKATLSKCVTGAHAAKTGTFKTRCYPDTATVRVWRVA